MKAGHKHGTPCKGDLCVDDGSHCGVPDPRNIYVCTRKKGHSGPHIACSGSNHNLKSWSVLPSFGRHHEAPETAG